MDETRDRIIAAARDLHLGSGADAVTMRAVAERVGVTATALYRHFADKEAILREVLAGEVREVGTFLFPALQEESPEARLRALAGRIAEFVLERPESYRTLFLTGSSREEAPSTVIRQRAAVFRFVVDRVRECIADGRVLDDCPPETVALTVWAQLHGLASLHLLGALPEGTPPLPVAARAALDRIFAGIGGRGAGR